MSKVRVHCFSISVDGYSSAPGQSKEHPFGPGGLRVVEWMFPTRSFHEMQKKPGGTTGIDHGMVVRSFEGIGAWILGRNMFTPSRGPWPADGWKGWWGEEPTYHAPTFILTHHPRPSIPMKGGTEFFFVTDGIQSALDQAKRAAKEKDVRIVGGATTVRQYLQAGLIDELHVAQSAVLLGAGESIFDGTDLHGAGYECTERIVGERAVHLFLKRRA